MKKMSFYIADVEKAQLDAYCQKNERNLTEVIRDAIRQYLQSQSS